jgi:hypothetical protein
MPDAAQFTLALFDRTGLGASVQAPARVHAADAADLHEADAESPPQLGTARVEPLRRDCDATRTRVHAGDASPHQGHRTAGTTGRTPRGIPGVRSMSGRTAEREKWNRCAEAHRLRTVSCPLGLMRGLIISRSPSRSRIPASPSSRARAPVMTGEAPSARAASVSLRSRAGRAARGRAVPTPVSVDRTRGNDAGTEPAPVLRGTTEGTKRCPDSSTACN